MPNPRALLAAAAAIGVIALVGWAILLPGAPPPPAAAAGEPWPGAHELVGRWRLHEERREACLMASEYDLPLAIRPPPLNDTVHGVLTVRSHGCGKPERIERFDVTIEQDEYKDLATTMAVMDCTEAGAPCATPPAGRKGRLRLGGGRLFFGSQALARAP